MTIRRHLAAVVVAWGHCCCTAVWPSVAQPTEPLAFRGIALGSTITDLRRTRFAEVAGAQIICTHDAEADAIRPSLEFELSPEEIEAGIVVCGAFVFARPFGATASTLPAEWLPARLDIAGVEMSPRFWFEVPEAAGGAGGDAVVEGLLFRIRMHSNAANWEVVRAAFLTRYGRPSVSGPAPSPLEFGKLDNAHATWSTGNVTLKLTKRLDLPNRMVVEFERRPANSLAE